MPQILVRGMDEAAVRRLKERARRRGRSLQMEVKEILEQAAAQLAPEEARKAADKLAARIHRRRGAMKGDSAELIREDRNR